VIKLRSLRAMPSSHELQPKKRCIWQSPTGDIIRGAEPLVNVVLVEVVDENAVDF
jgi:hypothetical protein